MPHNHPGEKPVPPPEPEEVEMDDGFEIFDEGLTVADQKTKKGLNPLVEPAAELQTRSKFILETLRKETEDLLLKKPDNFPERFEQVLDDKRLLTAPELGGDPVNEDDIRLMMALVAEDVRRNAERIKDEAAEKRAKDLIFFLIGVGPDLVGNVLHDAVLEYVKGNQNDPYFLKVMGAAEKKGL
jgi:hypothetical protein